jgi:hypothetical protein
MWLRRAPVSIPAAVTMRNCRQYRQIAVSRTSWNGSNGSFRSNFNSFVAYRGTPR